MSRKIIAVLCMYMMICMLPGCGAKQPDRPTAPIMREVYADNSVIIDAGEPEEIGESGGAYRMHLHIANRSAEPIVMCTRLCAYVKNGDERIQCTAPSECGISGTDVYHGIDGIIRPQQYADGWVVFECSDLSIATMNIASDFTKEQWISFQMDCGNNIDKEIT